MSYYNNLLKGITTLKGPPLAKNIGLNLQHFYEDNFIRLGGFNNVQIPQSSYAGPDQSRLVPVQLGTGIDGRTWQTQFSNLVWESSHSSVIPITGLYINNTFLPSNSFAVDYPKGRITFTSSIPTTSVIQMSYSYKWASFRVGESALCTKLMNQSIDYEVSGSPTGVLNILAENRLRMPCVFIQDVSTESTKGIELGNGAFYQNENYFFYVYASNSDDRDKLVEIFTNQVEKTIMMYNLDAVSQSGVYPLLANGNINPSGLSYSDLINQYPWKRCRFVRCGKDPIQYEQRLFRGIVRNTLEVQIG